VPSIQTCTCLYLAPSSELRVHTAVQCQVPCTCTHTNTFVSSFILLAHSDIVSYYSPKLIQLSNYKCGPMPNVMAALPLFNAAVWLTTTTAVSCSNAGKNRNPLTFTGVPQTRQQISAVSRLKFTVLSGHVKEVFLLNKFFPIVDVCLSSEDIAQQSCTMVPKCRFFVSCIFSEPVRHISDMHSKFALRPHHVWKYGRHPISDH